MFTSVISLLISTLMLVVTALGAHEPIANFLGIPTPALAEKQRKSTEALMRYLAGRGLQGFEVGVLAPSSDAERYMKHVRRIRVAHADTIPNTRLEDRDLRQQPDYWEVCDIGAACTQWGDFRFDSEGLISTAQRDGWWMGELILGPGATGESEGVHLSPAAGLRLPDAGAQFAVRVINQSASPITVTECLFSDSASGDTTGWEFDGVVMDPWTQRGIFCAFDNDRIGAPQHVGLEFVRGGASEGEVIWVTFEPESEA